MCLGPKSWEESGVALYDYGFRIYNPGIARFLSVDPLALDYPELTPYQFASNSPILAVDLDGLEAVPYSLLQEFADVTNGRANFLVSHDEVAFRYGGSWMNGPTTTRTSSDGSFAITAHTDTRSPGNDFIATNGYYNLSHSANGYSISATFGASGRATDGYVITAPFRVPRWYRFSAIIEARSVSYLLRRNQGSFRREAFPGATTVGDVLYNSVFGSTTRESRLTEATVTLDAFRHLAYSAILTITSGEDFAKAIGDGHERDATGLLNDELGSVVDLLNNAYGRLLGSEFLESGGSSNSLSNPDSLAKFLNSVVGALQQSGYDVSDGVFDGSQPEVVDLAKTLE